MVAASGESGAVGDKTQRPHSYGEQQIQNTFRDPILERNLTLFGEIEQLVQRLQQESERY